MEYPHMDFFYARSARLFLSPSAPPHIPPQAGKRHPPCARTVTFVRKAKRRLAHKTPLQQATRPSGNKKTVSRQKGKPS